MQLFTLILITIISVGANFFNLVIIYNSPALWPINNCLLTALTITDFLTGLIVMPCAISALLQGSDAILCKIQGFLVTLFNGASLVMATAVSVDRCSAVYNPYNYLSDLRASRYAISIAAV
ncbi:uncharacterized protein TRIADDRAFT_34175, partial [Trichoplax adhaerens]